MVNAHDAALRLDVSRAGGGVNDIVNAVSVYLFSRAAK
jgi:hypothetical protein